jgi:predicted RNA methylase
MATMTEELDRLPDSAASVSDSLRQLLKTAGYVDSGIEECMGEREWIPLLPPDSAPGTPLNTLLRLFHMQKSVSEEDAAQGLRPLTLEQLIQARFLRRDGDRIAATVQIEPYHDLLVASPYSDDDENKVMLISLTTMEMANFAVRLPSRKTLDLGTGSGVQALRAAPHSEQVYAVDINPRAIATAEFNCRWNGFRNITCLQGSLFEPVADHRFDLIVSNPPFVISPAMRHRFRDSGMVGDQFALDLARQASSFLNEGGYFQMMFQWIDAAAGNWRQRLSASLSGLGCDVWLLHTQSEIPEAYVAAWLRADSQKEDASDSSYDDWLRYLNGLGTKSIETGLVAMQRRSGPRNYIWFDDAPSDRSQPYGGSVPDIFAIRQYLEERGEQALLEEKVKASPQLKMIQESKLEGTNWRPGASEFQFQTGLRYCFDNVDPVLAAAVAGCDGQRTLREVLESVAIGRGSPVDGLVTKHLSQLRELLWYGFLRPVWLADRSADTSGQGLPQAMAAAD